MVLGIEEIACYLPERRISNYLRAENFQMDNIFLEDKIGVRSVSVKQNDEDTSDLCIKAFDNLSKKMNIDKKTVDALVVITQNPDCNIPHTSAIIHNKLNLNGDCACFDVSLGCSGFVYGLSIIQSFMESNGFAKGLLFTSDPYSKIIDQDDKNTSLLFGDAATVTLISDKPVYQAGKFLFGTEGIGHGDLTLKKGKLFMNGRSIFNFSMKYVPSNVINMLARNNLDIAAIDKFIFHQASKYIIDNITKRLNLDNKKVVFDIYDYGNTVSSSIPIILEREIKNSMNNYIAICGFGVGFSWASTILKNVKG